MVARVPNTVIAERANEEVSAAPPVLLGKNKAPLCSDAVSNCAGEAPVGDTCPKSRKYSSMKAHVLLAPGYLVLVCKAFGMAGVSRYFKLARHL